MNKRNNICTFWNAKGSRAIVASHTHAYSAFSARLGAVYLRLTLQKRDNNEVRKLGCDPVPQNQIPWIRSSGSYLSGHSCRWMPLEWAKCAWPVFRVAEKSKWDLAINRSSNGSCQNHLWTEFSDIGRFFLVFTKKYSRSITPCTKQFLVSILNIILFDTPMENKFRNDKIIIIFIVILEFLFWEYCILIYLLFQT